MKFIIKKILPMLLAVLILLSIIPIGAMAADYEGRGTKSSPYLVKTAQQLANMANKPAAHYKLAANIDLGSIKNFTPIGYLAKPFTGSFVCDRNSDGSPKYIIKNLKIQVSGMPSHTDYIKNNSHWEAALFGATNGAIFEGIAVVDFKIKNTVEGLNQMGYGNDAWHSNPGQDEMASAGLVAISKDSTYKYCIAIGEIYESTSNWCGGLIGGSNGGNTISYCYANVNIDSEGLWNHGTFIGGTRARDKIEWCYSEGDLSKAMVSKDYSTGGFVGEHSGIIENCYVTNTKVVSGGSSFVGNNTGTVKNSYTTAVVVGSSKTAGANSANNNYCLNTKGCVEDDFKSVSAADLKKAFGSISGWDVSGDYPAIKNTVGKIDADNYKVSANSETTSSQTQSTTSTTSQEEQSGEVSQPSEQQESTQSEEQTNIETESTTQEDEEQSSSVNVEDLAFLKEIRTESDITVEQAYIIISTMGKLIDMSPDERKELGEYMGLLSQYNTAAMLLVVGDFTEKVEALPNVKKLNSETAKQIKELYATYEGLTDDVKAVFTSETIKKLEDAYAAAKKFDEQGSAVASTAMTNSEKLIVIVLLSLSVLALAGALTLIILNVVANKKKKVLEEEESEE